MAVAEATIEGPGASRRNAAQWFCLVGGAVLLIRGAVGLALDPAFEMPGEGWHQLIHMTTGALLLAANRGAGVATVAALAFGLAYAAVAVIGIVNGNEVVGLIPIATSDNAIHSLITVAALGSGIASLAAGPISARRA